MSTAAGRGFRAARFPLLVLTASLAACGGGGGGFDDGDQILLNAYEFAITNPTGAPSPLTVTVVTPGSGSDVHSINAGTGTVTGDFNLNTGDFIADEGSTYTVNWSQGGPVPAQFTVAVTLDADLDSGNFQPGTGALAVTWGDDTITVQYGATNGNTRIALNGGAPVDFTPVNFIGLDDPTSVAPDWQQVAARASQALVTLLTQTRVTAAFLVDIYDGELDSGQTVDACTAIPGIPPGNVLSQGEVVRTSLGSGDYDIVATDCFSRASSVATTGFLVNATNQYRNLVVTEDVDGVITRFGFEGSALIPGGVDLDLTIETLNEINGTNWNFTGDATLYGGGFSLVFTEP